MNSSLKTSQFMTMQFRRRSAISRRHSPLTCLLETFPPIFPVVLISGLTYYALAMNPYSNEWKMATVFVVSQIVLNWVFFLANKSSVATSSKNFPGYQHERLHHGKPGENRPCNEIRRKDGRMPARYNGGCKVKRYNGMNRKYKRCSQTGKNQG